MTLVLIAVVIIIIKAVDEETCRKNENVNLPFGPAQFRCDRENLESSQRANSQEVIQRLFLFEKSL